MQLVQPCPSNHRTYRTSAKRIQVVTEHRRIQRNPTKRIQVITEYTEHGRTRSPPTKRIQVIREPCKTISNNHRTHKHGHTRRNPTKRIQVITEHTEHRRTCRNHTKWIQAITEHRRTQKPTKRTEVITEHAEHRRTRNNPTKRSNHRTHKIRTRTQKPYTTNSVRALLSSGLISVWEAPIKSVEAGQELLSLSRYWRWSLHRRQPLRQTWKGRLPKAAFSVLWFEFSFIRTWAGVHYEVVSSEKPAPSVCLHIHLQRWA